MPMVNVSLQVLPVVQQEKIYPVVDRVIELIQKSGVKYVVGPMETTMEEISTPSWKPSKGPRPYAVRREPKG